LGKVDDARDTIQQLLKLSAHFTIARAVQAFPTRSTDYRMAMAAAFEQAGLPAG
jgi:hypothetical protein